jgi:hypothetical protein
LRKDKKAITPAISTVIMTSVIVVMVLVALSYANNYLILQMAGGEFSSDQNFMVSTGLQIDAVAWNIGATQTVQYTTRDAQVTFVPAILNYIFEISTNNGASYQTAYNCTTGMVLVNMPLTYYTLGNNYFSRIFPSSSGSILQWNTSAPVSQVFAVQKTPMADGNYVRIVTVPVVRLLNFTLARGTQSYFKFYLPPLISGSNQYLSQSVTLTGTGLTKIIPSGAITNVRIKATSLASNSNPPGFDLTFFNFDHTDVSNSFASEVVNIPLGSSVEINIGGVSVSLGSTG